MKIEKTTILPCDSSPTGYVVTFRYKAPERSWVGVIGDWMFSDEHHSSHFASAMCWPHEWHINAFPHTLLGLKQTPSVLFNKGEKVDPSTFQFDWDVLKLGLYEMEKDEATGIFECALPLPSGTFNYRFVLEVPEGNPLKMVTIPDPNNLPTYAYQAEQKFSQIFMPFDDKLQKDNRSIEGPCLGVKQGKVVYKTYRTGGHFVDSKEQITGIYLPADYDHKRATPYPVLFLSHGGGGCFSDWFTQGALKQLMDNLINQGKLDPTIVVTMDNAVFDWDNTGKCIPNIVDYLIPYIEKNYHISQQPEKRAFAGFSAGGFLAFDIYYHKPHLFGYFGIWSAGQRGTLDYNNEMLRQPTLHIGGGRYDDAFFSFGYVLEDTLSEHQIPFTSYFPNGAHQWSVWRKLLEDFAGRVLWKS